LETLRAKGWTEDKEKGGLIALASKVLPSLFMGKKNWCQIKMKGMKRGSKEGFGPLRGVRPGGEEEWGTFQRKKRVCT